MSPWKKLNRFRSEPAVSVTEHEALKRRVSRLTKTIDDVVVREARLQEELSMLRRELMARDVPATN